jgi:hypothetical protein
MEFDKLIPEDRTCRLFSEAPGQVALLDVIVAGGMACEKAGIGWADGITMAALSVVLVKLGKVEFAPHGWRIAALFVMVLIGTIGAIGLNIRSGQLVVSSTVAVLLVVIGEHAQPVRHGRGRRPDRGNSY